MPLPSRVSQPVRDALAVRYAASLGSGTAAKFFSDASADKQQMPRPWMRAILRKVADVGTIAAATVEAALKRDGVAIADGATDTVIETIAATPVVLTYELLSTGTNFLTAGPIVIAAETNCTAELGDLLQIDQPAIAADGTVVTLSQDTQASLSDVPALASAFFDITVTPDAAGAWSFTVSIANSDSNENPYNWTASGTAVTAAPEMAVLVGVDPLADGGTDAVGSIASGAPTARTFTINNTGGAALGITVPVVIGSLVNCAVAATAQPTASVAAFGTTSYAINITPTAPGAFSFTVSMANTDSNENPYNWTTSGTAT